MKINWGLNNTFIDFKKLKSYLTYGLRQLHKDGGEFVSENEPNNKNEAISYIKKYCVNLNDLAMKKKILIGFTFQLKQIWLI